MSGGRPRIPPTLSSGVARRWRALSGMGEAELVPQPRLAGPMPWVIAIMVALTVIAAAAGFALRNMAQTVEEELAGGVTVQIVEAGAAARTAQTNAVLEVLTRTPQVRDVRLVPQDEVDQLVEPWLGTVGGDAEAVPVPALIDLRLEGRVSEARLAGLREVLRPVAPAARVDAQSNWLRPVFSAIASLQWLALALIVLLALALAAAVLLAARTALGAARETIEIVHLLGGTDGQIARVFQRSIAFDAAGGGAVGLALGLGAVLLLGRQFAALGTGMVSGGALDWLDWILLALVPVAGVLLAALTARLTVLAALRKML
jgi:cell division transport system permease protein